MPALRAQKALKLDLFNLLATKDVKSRNLKQRKEILDAILEELIERKTDSDAMELQIEELNNEINSAIKADEQDKVLGL